VLDLRVSSLDTRRPGIVMDGTAGTADGSRTSTARVVRIIVINVLFSLLAVGLAIAIVESYYRLSWDPPPLNDAVAERYVADQRMNHAFQPNLNIATSPHPQIPRFVFKTNELGLRIGHEYSIQKPPGTKRIVFAGDSFVEGYDYDMTVPARLERGLQPDFQKEGLRLEVIHAGTGSYSPVLHYMALKYKLLQLQPDVVVVAIDMTDTFDDYVKYGPIVQWRGEEPIAVPSEMAGIQRSIRQGMVKNLHFYERDFWIAATFDYLHLSQYIFDKNIGDYAKKYTKFREYWVGDHGFKRPLFDVKNPETRERIEYSLTWIARIVDLLRVRGIRLVIAMYPYKIQLQDPTLLSYFDVYADFAEKHGVLFHSAVNAFQNQPNIEALFLSGDTHYNYVGQEVWATALIDFFRAHMKELLGATPPGGDPASR
jgi:hypothetical protein